MTTTDEWVPQFWGSKDGFKAICTTCGRTGMDLRGPDGTIQWGRNSWMDECMKPHPFKCICGKAFPKAAGRSNHIGKQKRNRHLHGVVMEEQKPEPLGPNDRVSIYGRDDNDFDELVKGLVLETPEMHPGDPGQCDYMFRGKRVIVRCGYSKSLPHNHGDWRDPVTNVPV